jgi:hypothetical protein
MLETKGRKRLFIASPLSAAICQLLTAVCLGILPDYLPVRVY